MFLEVLPVYLQVVVTTSIYKHVHVYQTSNKISLCPSTLKEFVNKLGQSETGELNTLQHPLSEEHVVTSFTTCCKQLNKVDM